jgi:hypothetical protein
MTAYSDTTNFSQSGRVAMTFSGQQNVSDNGYVAAKGQALINQDGGLSADDMWLAIGEYDDWEVKIGRFEATNLAPAGQDTYLNHAGGVVYNAGHARGRSADGQINLSKTTEKVYFELSTNFMAADSDSSDGTADTNAVFARPVVAVTMTDSLKLTAGAEVNLTADEKDSANDFTGYGATLNYAAGGVDLNINYATRDFDSTTQEDTTFGANVLYSNFALGYVNGTSDTATETEVETIYASYKFANVMDVEDLAIYVGAYTSEVKGSDDASSGARLRLFYAF